MDTIFIKGILISLGTVFLASFLALIVTCMTWMYVLFTSFTTEQTRAYTSTDNVAVMELVHDKEVGSLNLYRILSVSSESIKEYSIKDKDNSTITDLDLLKNHPTWVFDVQVDGEASTGYEITAKRKD